MRPPFFPPGYTVITGPDPDCDGGMVNRVMFGEEQVGLVHYFPTNDGGIREDIQENDEDTAWGHWARAGGYASLQGGKMSEKGFTVEKRFSIEIAPSRIDGPFKLEVSGPIGLQGVTITKGDGEAINIHCVQE